METQSLSELQSLTKSLTIEENRLKLDKPKMISLIKLLNESNQLDIQLECLRALRNGVANIPTNAQIVVENVFADELEKIVEKFLNSEEHLTCLRVLLQLLANSVGQDIPLKADQIKYILDVSKEIYNKTNDEKCINYLSFAMLSIMKKNIVSIKDFHDFILHWGKNISSDFSLLCLKHIIEKNQLSEIKSDRQDVYTAIKDLELHQGLSDSCIVTLVKDFTYLTDFVFKVNQSSISDLKPQETMTMLEIIISISKTEKKSVLQENKSLLINTLYLLRMAHDAGKEAQHEDFKPITKIKDLAELRINKDSKENSEGNMSEKAALENNPVFGFKVKLIQLLVNLVWEHQENQNLVSEHAGFHLLLDCSQVDARNPFITQWVVMSVKALCQDNPSNKAILAGLRREGVADSALWAELGIKLDDAGEKV